MFKARLYLRLAKIEAWLVTKSAKFTNFMYKRAKKHVDKVDELSK